MIRRAALATTLFLVGCLPRGGAATEPHQAWPELPPLPVGPMVVFADGGFRAGALVALDDAAITLDTPTAAAVRLPRAAVAGFRASLAVGLSRAAVAPEAIVITLANGDVVEATAVSAADGTVRFTPARGVPPTVAVPIGRVLALDFPAAAAPRGEAHWVALDDGSRCTSTAAPAIDTAGVVASVVEGPGMRFLTSLAAEPPAASGHRVWPTVRGTTGFTACRLHAPARVRYRLEQPAARFLARVAIDDAAGQGGSVVVAIRVRGDDGDFHDVFVSSIIRGGDEPAAIAADLAGSREIEIVVDPADVGTVLDRTIWLDPRIER